MSDAKPTEEPPGRTTVLVLNYNGQQHLEACLESLGRMDVFVPGSPGVARDRSQRDEVWLVDNASTDNSVALVRARFPWVRVVENESNLRFSRAYSLASAVCQTRWVVFLNNDTCVGSDWLSALHAAAARHPGAAATASRIMGWDGERIDFVRAGGCSPPSAARHMGRGNFEPRALPPGEERVVHGVQELRRCANGGDPSDLRSPHLPPRMGSQSLAEASGEPADLGGCPGPPSRGRGASDVQGRARGTPPRRAAWPPSGRR